MLEYCFNYVTKWARQTEECRQQMNNSLSQELLAYLLSFATENKQELIVSRMLERTRHITVVLEDIYQEHNASAVLWTCDCFGIQELRTIKKNNEYKIQRYISRGAGRWVHLYGYGSGISPTLECLHELKSIGYKIVATTPHEKYTKLSELPLDCPMALVFGTEMDGISVNGIDMITFDDAGLIIDFKVMIRPLQAVNKVHQQMGDMLKAMKASQT